MSDGGHAEATVLRADEVAGAFVLLNPVSPREIHLSDDGTLVTFGNWCEPDHGIVIAAYSLEGVVRWSYELADLFETSVQERLCSGYPPVWQRQPSDASFATDADGRETVALTLWNEDRLAIAVEDGEIRYMLVTDLGDDPDRLKRRGYDLLRAGDYKRGVEVLQRVLALDPARVGVYRALAQAHSDKDRHEEAIEVLLQGAIANPVAVASSGGWSGGHDSRLLLLLDLARAYERVGKLKQAEITYGECLRADPESWEAGRALADLWLRGCRDSEADRLLSYLLAVAARGESTYSASPRTAASEEVGRIYHHRGRYERARDHYSRALEEGEFKPRLARDLAEVLAQLGDDEGALHLLQQLKAHLAGTGRAEYLRRATDEDIERIAANLQGAERRRLPRPTLPCTELADRAVSRQGTESSPELRFRVRSDCEKFRGEGTRQTSGSDVH